MPLLLILGPMVGIAALAILVARAHKGSATPHAQASAQQFELDREMPQETVHQVLAALTHEQDAARLEALARELGTKHPIAASELRAKIAAVSGAASGAAPPPAATSAGQPGGGSSAMTPPSPDTGEAALVLQAAMRAYAQESDPVSLEGFAESIRPKFPTAAVLLLGRARELRAMHAASQQAGVSPSPAPIMPGSTLAPATYVVQAGDTPIGIAETFAHDGRRWPELVGSNPHKPTAPDGSFASMRQGETLNLPASWAVPAPSPAHPTVTAREARQ